MANTASYAPRIRLVRCPKCLRILTEVADVPVYLCGGCGTTLKAKYHNSSTRDVGVGSSNSAHSPNLSQSSSSNELYSSGEMVPSLHSPSPDISTINEQVRPLNLLNSSKSKSMESQGKGIEDESETYSSITIKSNENSTTNGEYISDISDGQNIGKKAVEQLDTGKCFVENVASDEDSMDEEISQIQLRDNLRSPSIGNSLVYDDSVSSSDEGPIGTGPSKYHNLSRRTFGRKKSIETMGYKTRAEGENFFGNDSTKNSLQMEHEANELPQKMPREKNSSTFDRSFHSTRQLQDWGTSFTSEDFYTMKSWVGTEKNRSLQTRNISSSSTQQNHFDYERLDLLREVEELRNQISVLCNQRAESKSRDHYTSPYSSSNMSNFNRFSKMSPLGKPCQNLHCISPSSYHNNGECSRACVHYVDSQTSSYNSTPLVHNRKPTRIYQQGKRLRPKRYCIPIRGAAPFVICYKCLKLLQIPVDLLASKRKSSKLQCGSCSEIFVVPSDTFADLDINSDVNVACTPPPSEIDNTAHCGRQGDPFSYAEDYDASLYKSASSDTEIVPRVARNSVEETDIGQGGALHQLMGYRSAREILYLPSDLSERF